MAEKYDAIVAGLGPAGSCAANYLARGNLKVLALEKQRMPRDKLCAGGITKKVLPLLDFDYSSAVDNPIYGGVIYFKNNAKMEVTLPEPGGYIVKRSIFDARLARRAAEAGAEIHEAEPITAISEQEGSVEVTTPRGRYQASYLVGADGANGFTPRYLGRKASRRNGLAVEINVPLNFPIIERLNHRCGFYYGDFPFGYGWIFPKREEASVGLGVALKHKKEVRRFFAEFLRQIGLPEELARRAKGYPLPAYTWLLGRHWGERRILLAGDAANLIDPVTGEGIYYAMKSGELAARAILETIQQDGEYPTVYRRYLKQEVLSELSSAFKMALPIYLLPGMSFSALNTDPSVKGIYLDVLLGKAGYPELIRQAKRSIFYIIKAKFSSAEKKAL